VLFAGAAAFVLCPRICRETGSRDTIPFPLSCACLNDAASAAAADDDDEGEEDSPPLVFTARVANSGRLTLAEGWKSQTLSVIGARRRVCNIGFIVCSMECAKVPADM
jgi:hypothetical protein